MLSKSAFYQLMSEKASFSLLGLRIGSNGCAINLQYMVPTEYCGGRDFTGRAARVTHCVVMVVQLTYSTWYATEYSGGRDFISRDLQLGLRMRSHGCAITVHGTQQSTVVAEISFHGTCS